jgi:hypothetical protein
MMKSVEILIASLLFGLIAGGATPVQALEPLESQVMAAMLFNFTKYVEWPADTVASNNQFVICIAGNNPFIGNYDRYQNKISKGKIVNIREINGPQEVTGCNLLFIDQSEQALVAAYLQQTARMPILTISNINQFVSKHGIIGFGRRDDRISFEINLEESRRSRLIFSSNLLKLATKVLSDR